MGIIRDVLGDPTLVFLTAGAFIKYTALTWLRKRKFEKFVPVGKVSSIRLYPIKSCKPVLLDEAFCGRLGVTDQNVVDRSFLIVTSDGNYLTQRQEPSMALIGVRIGSVLLHLSAPGMHPIDVPKNISPTKENTVICKVKWFEIPAVDCGMDAADWVSKYLNMSGLRLLYCAPELPKRDITQHTKPWQHKALQGDQANFSDFCGYMMTSEASLSQVNNELTKPVTMENFRPNIVVSGCPAFDEETWSEVKIGTATFRGLDLCTRCVLINVDPQSGTSNKDGEPLKTMERFHSSKLYENKSLFGLNASLDDAGVIQIGDLVYAMRA